MTLLWESKTSRVPRMPRRIEVLRFLIAAIEASLSELQTLKASLDELAIPPEWQEVAHYQIATADYESQAHQTGRPGSRSS
jgi:hypothetical protein